MVSRKYTRTAEFCHHPDECRSDRITGGEWAQGRLSDKKGRETKPAQAFLKESFLSIHLLTGVHEHTKT